MCRQTFKKNARAWLSVVLTLAMILGVFCLSGPAAAVSAAVDETTVANGDFESGRTGYAVRDWHLTSMTSKHQPDTVNDWASKYTLVTAAENGSKVASLTKDGMGYAALTSAPIEITGGNFYRLRYDFRTSDILNAEAAADFYGIHAVLQQLDEAGNELSWTVLNDVGTDNSSIGLNNGWGKTVSSEWETVTHDFAADSNAVSAVLYFAVGGKADVKATVLFDDVSVSAYGNRELVNGDFEGLYFGAEGGRAKETAGPAGWHSYSANTSGKTETTNNYHNRYAAEIVTEANGDRVLKHAPAVNSPMGYSVLQSAELPVTAGETYWVNYDLKVEISAGGSINSIFASHVVVRYFNAAGEYLDGVISGNTGTAQDWTAMSYTNTVPNGAVTMTVGFFIGGSTKGYAYYYDDVAVSFDDGSRVLNGDGELSATAVPGWSIISMENTNQSSVTAGTNNNYHNNFTLSAAVGEGVDGSTAIKAAKKSSYGYAALLSSAVNVTPGTDYRLSYAYKLTDIVKGNANGIVRPIRVLLWQYDADGNRLTNTASEALINTPSGSVSAEITDWQSVTTGFTAVENAAYCRIHFWMGGASASIAFNAWYDNIAITALPDTDLQNGNFETVLYNTSSTGITNAQARPAFWTSVTTKPDGTVRTDINCLPHYGMAQVNDGVGHETAAKLFVTRSGGGFGGVTYYSQPVTVQAGTSYTSTFDLKIAGVAEADESNSYGAKVMLRYLDATGAIIGIPSLLNDLLRANQDWASYSYEFTVPEGAVALQIGLTIGVATMNRNADMAYYFDDLTLAETASLKDPAVVASSLYQQRVLFIGDEIGGGLSLKAESISDMVVTDQTAVGAGFADSLTERVYDHLQANAVGSYDYLVISGGLYDAIAGVAAGTMDTSYTAGYDPATFAGALEETFIEMATIFDGVKIAYLFPYQTAGTDLSVYRNTAQQVADKWNVPFIDLSASGDMQPYQPDGMIVNDEGFSLLWNDLIETMETLPAFDSTQIPGFSPEFALTIRLGNLIGEGVTPATDVKALNALLDRVKANGSFPAMETKIEGYLAEYEAYRPQILGATIAAGDANKLKFFAVAPTAVLPDTVTLSGMGLLVLPESGKTPTLASANVSNIKAAYTKAGARYDGYLSGYKVDPTVRYVAVAYTVYEVDGERIEMYSTNDYTNPLGEKTAENGRCVKSVYGVAQAMADRIVAQNADTTDWSAVGGKQNADKIALATEESEPSLYDVLLFVSGNETALGTVLENGGASK